MAKDYRITLEPLTNEAKAAMGAEPKVFENEGFFFICERGDDTVTSACGEFNLRSAFEGLVHVAKAAGGYERLKKAIERQLLADAFGIEIDLTITNKNSTDYEEA